MMYEKKIRRCSTLLLIAFASVSMLAAQSRAPSNPAQPSASSSADPPASGGAANDTTTHNFQIRVQSNLVTAPVTVINRVTGEYVYDLDKNDFRIYDNGVPQEIARFTREPDKIAAVFVIQDSDEVAPLLSGVKQIAPVVSRFMLAGKGEAAVLTFGDLVHKAQGFSSSEDVLDKTLHAIRSDGHKARLNDALMQAMNMLMTRPRDERRVIIAISSGYDAGSAASRDAVIQRASASEVEIYGLGLSLTKGYLKREPGPKTWPANPATGPNVPGQPHTPNSSSQSFGVPTDVTEGVKAAVRGTQSLVKKNDVEAYADYTGGVFYSQWSSSALQMRLNEIASELHSQYQLAYVPDDLSKGGFHQLEIRVDRPGVKIRTRKGYFYQSLKH